MSLFDVQKLAILHLDIYIYLKNMRILIAGYLFKFKFSVVWARETTSNVKEIHVEAQFILWITL